jgi:hypothetical protein
MKFKKGDFAWSLHESMQQYNDENQPKLLEIISVDGDKARCKFFTSEKTPQTKYKILPTSSLELRPSPKKEKSFSQQLLERKKR